jgi:hypothetical protein
MTGSSGNAANFPPLYARWLADAIAAELPGEPFSTCDRCAMLDGPPSSLRFDASTKCCTYTPVLPNFLAGAILGDLDPAAADGRASLVARIARRAAVTPLGLGTTRSQKLVYEHLGNGFGRATALRCAHYVDREGGQCGIWRHRNAVCATWFCKHERGAVGFALWRALEALLTAVERSLAIWTALEVGVDPELIHRALPARHAHADEPLTATDIDGREPADYAALWGPWRDREADLYAACAARASGLEWQDVERICGPEVALYRRRIQARLAAHGHPQLPARLRGAAYRVIHHGREVVRLQTYSAYDPIELPSPLIHALASFDGRPVADGVRALADDHGIDLAPDLLQSLVDFAVLSDADLPDPQP